MKMLAVVLALSLAAPAEAACRYGHCGRLHHAGRVYGSGRVLSSVPQGGRIATPRPLNRPSLTERPVPPGQTALPAFLPNNAPPVFAPQPIP
jgi:hypothetical protein